MEVDPSVVLVQAGSGFVIGVLLGWSIRKLAKALLMVIGLYLASLVFVASLGWIVICWDKVASSIGWIFALLTGRSETVIESLIATSPLGLALASGFIVGVTNFFKGLVEPTTRRSFKFIRREEDEN